MVRWIYTRSFAPNEFSISRRIASNSRAGASGSAILRWAYSATSVMAISASPDDRRTTPRRGPPGHRVGETIVPSVAVLRGNDSVVGAGAPGDSPPWTRSHRELSPEDH